MIEPFFGSSAPMWSGVPSPGFAWPAPSTLGSRTVGSAVPGFGLPPLVTPVSFPQGFNGVVASPADPFGYGAPGMPGVISALAGPDVLNGPPARALVAAIALRRGQPMGPANDQEIEEFIYDAFDVLLGTNDVEVRVDGGRATLTGSVAHKRLKRDVGEIAWAIPGIADVHNNVTIVGRRRSRAGRESESQPAPAGRKQT
jgi:BON domain